MGMGREEGGVGMSEGNRRNNEVGEGAGLGRSLGRCQSHQTGSTNTPSVASNSPIPRGGRAAGCPPCPSPVPAASPQCPPPLFQQCSPSVPTWGYKCPSRAMDPPQPPVPPWTCPQPSPFPSLPQRDLRRRNRAELKEGHLKAPSPNWPVPSPKLEPPSPAQPPAEPEMPAPPSLGPAAKLNKTNQTTHFTK